jgi:hypothetical protein
MLIDKKEDMRASSEDITESTPEAEGDLHPHTDHPENAGQPKRKGGRKPVCIVLRHDRLYPLTSLDLCDVGRTEAAQPPGSGSIQGTPHRVHQAARGINPCP